MGISVVKQPRYAGVLERAEGACNAGGDGMSNTETETRQHAAQTSARMTSSRRLLLLLPVILFSGLALALGYGLTRDPGELESVLIDKPVPEFSLPPVQGRELGLSSADLKGEVSLVNVWASWCVPCRREKPLFLRLKDEGVVPIHGLNYKDEPAEAARFLDTYGDAYTRTGADRDGRVAIDWGVYGLPETFVVDRYGRIAYRHVGELTPQALRQTILPIVRRLQEQ